VQLADQTGGAPLLAAKSLHTLHFFVDFCTLLLCRLSFKMLSFLLHLPGPGEKITAEGIKRLDVARPQLPKHVDASS